jgi:hypothetical protein
MDANEGSKGAELMGLAKLVQVQDHKLDRRPAPSIGPSLAASAIAVSAMLLPSLVAHRGLLRIKGAVQPVFCERLSLTWA